MCKSGCSECIEGYYETKPNESVYKCTDEGLYRFGNICPTNDPDWPRTKCATGSGSKCHKSFPLADPDKLKSPAAACRTIPDEFLTGDLTFGVEDCLSPTGGLCHYGSCSGTCHQSWLQGESWRSPSTMCRCRGGEQKEDEKEEERE